MVSFILSPIHIRTIQSNQYLDLILMVQATTSPIPETQALIRDSANVAGFMIFLSIVCFIIQIPTIVGRFILKGGTALIFVLHLVVSHILFRHNSLKSCSADFFTSCS